MMQGWYFAKNLTRQRHDRVQTEAKNCNHGKLFRPCWVSSARRSKSWRIKLGRLDFLVTQISAPGHGSPRMASPLIKPFFNPSGWLEVNWVYWKVSFGLKWVLMSRITFFHESLSFEHHCIKESYFVLWYFGREFYCWVKCVSLFNKTLFHLFSFTYAVLKGENIISVIVKNPSITSYKRLKSPKDMLVRAKL